MKTAVNLLLVCLAAVSAVSCMEYGARDTEMLSATGKRGLFVINEGGWTNSEASLSYYDIDARHVENEVFVRRNGVPLGDVAQSMTLFEGKAFVTVNNSSVVFVINPDTFVCEGKITDVNSPRYVHIIDDSKAYITELYRPVITVFNPRTLQVLKKIPTDFEGRQAASTEQMIGVGRYVFTNCWSYDDRLLVVDTDTDCVVRSIAVGKQPNSMVLDKNGMIWVLCDGGYEGNPIGYDAPSLWQVNPTDMSAEKVFDFVRGERAAALAMDGAGETLYVLKDHVWKLGIDQRQFPDEPLIRNNTGNYWYSLAVDPVTSEIYLADAVDKVQPGMVYRYSPQGTEIDRFKVGVIPGEFCFFERGE